MNVKTITVEPDVALENLQKYRGIELKQRREEDKHFRKLWKAASEGKPIIDVSAALRETGLSGAGMPKLAFVRASWDTCHFDKYYHTFQKTQGYIRTDVKSSKITIPSETWNWQHVKESAYSPVPFMPPEVRPKKSVENYHILFEVKEWNQYPVDPFLLRHITGWMYVVEAEWELTDLEAKLLTGLRA